MIFSFFVRYRPINRRNKWLAMSTIETFTLWAFKWMLKCFSIWIGREISLVFSMFVKNTLPFFITCGYIDGGSWKFFWWFHFISISFFFFNFCWYYRFFFIFFFFNFSQFIILCWLIFNSMHFAHTSSCICSLSFRHFIAFIDMNSLFFLFKILWTKTNFFLVFYLFDFFNIENLFD